MAQNDDWGWIAWIAILGVGGYYLWDRYDIVDTDAEPSEIAASPFPELPPSLPEKMYATTTPDGSEWSVDGTAIKGGRTARLAWLIEDHSKNKKVAHRETKTLYEMNCDRGSYLIRSVIEYDAEDKVSGSWGDEMFTDTPRYMAPRTLMASVFERACSMQVDDYLRKVSPGTVEEVNDEANKPT